MKNLTIENLFKILNQANQTIHTYEKEIEARYTEHITDGLELKLCFNTVKTFRKTKEIVEREISLREKEA